MQMMQLCSCQIVRHARYHVLAEVLACSTVAHVLTVLSNAQFAACLYAIA